MPTISVFIPSYNRAAFIGETIDSVLAQIRQADEVFVVDDGSEDETAEVVKAYARFGVKFVSKEHSGTPETRNLGLAHSRCEYVVTVGSDDVMFPDCLESLCRAYDEVPGLDLYFGDLIATAADLSPRKRIKYPRWQGRFEALSSALGFTSQISDGFAMVNRVWVIARGAYSKDFPRCQDWDLWSRNDQPFTVMHTGDDLGYWRWHDDNLSANRKSRFRISFDQAIRERVRKSQTGEAHLKNLGWSSLRELSQKRPVAVWGAGEYGEAVRLMLEYAGVTVSGYLDSDESKWGTLYGDLEVHGPDQLEIEAVRPLVVIGSVYEQEIAETLDSMGYSESIDYFRPRGVEYRNL